MDAVKYIIKYISYPLAMLLSGQRERKNIYQKSMKNQYRSYQENEREQNQKLYEIVTYAVEHVPYYQAYAREHNLSFSPETITEDVKGLPVMTKEIIRREGENLFSRETIPFHTETSGGSTGEPVKLRHDDALLTMTSGDYFLSYAGYEIGDKAAVLWGSERDILAGSIGLKAEIINRFVKRRKFLNSFRMDEKTMESYVERINSWKPKVILAYVQSIYELSKFIQEKGLEVYAPGGIVVSAGTLFPEWKQLIKTVFRCPVINQYGSRETPAIAVSCSQGDELHINSFLNYVEIVDEENNTLPEERDGEILVTNLFNRSMPLIRYKIGDVGAMSSKRHCACGRNLPCLSYVKGRTVNIFKRRDGTKIDGEYFTHLFYGLEEVRRFQVIQEDYDRIVVRMELKCESLEQEVLEKMTKSIQTVMGDACQINYETVKQLLPTKSGKHLYTISKV